MDRMCQIKLKKIHDHVYFFYAKAVSDNHGLCPWLIEASTLT